MGRILITGCSRGIGFELAHRMARNGWDVISTVHRAQGGLPGTIIEMDIASDASVQAAAKQAGSLDVLVNNACLRDFEKDVDVSSTPLSLLSASLEVNIVGTLRVCQAFIPALRNSPSGRIVNVTSIWGQVSGKGAAMPHPHPIYCISKGGINMITGLLAASLKPGISVNAVCPSAGRTMDAAIDEIVWAITDVGHDQTGKFFHNRDSVTSW